MIHRITPLGFYSGQSRYPSLSALREFPLPCGATHRTRGAWNVSSSTNGFHLRTPFPRVGPKSSARETRYIANRKSQVASRKSRGTLRILLVDATRRRRNHRRCTPSSRRHVEWCSVYQRESRMQAQNREILSRREVLLRSACWAGMREKNAEIDARRQQESRIGAEIHTVLLKTPPRSLRRILRRG